MQVIHFIGSGRSGTTLLNIILDNHPLITGVGELSYVTRHVWQELGYCGCGNKITDCEVWKEIYKKWLEETNVNVLDEYVSLQQKYERYRQLLMLFCKGYWGTKKFHLYSEYTTRLFSAALEINDVSFIADASKHPVRVWALSKIPGIDLRVIHVVRDPRGVSWSRKKGYSKNPQSGLGWNVKSYPVWKTTLRWITVNLISDFIVKHVEKAIIIRYEDIITDLYGTLIQIGDFIGEDFQAEVDKYLSGGSIKVGHLASGNRLRMQRKIELIPDNNWKNNMPAREKKLVWRLSNWLMKRYGYSKQY